MENKILVELNNIWKKYRIVGKFRKSLRESISSFFKKNEEIEVDEFWALQNINLTLRKGECVGIYGPNGSGKTTILKLISSITYPTKGEIKVNGKVAPLISVGAGFHNDLTGRENIITNGTILGMKLKEIKKKEESIIEFSEIDGKFLDMPVRKYSTGMYTRLGFSVAVHSTAEILLLDEILAVGDEQFREKCHEKIKELKDTKSIILVSHSMEIMRKIVDRIVYINKGVIVNEEKVTTPDEKI